MHLTSMLSALLLFTAVSSVHSEEHGEQYEPLAVGLRWKSAVEVTTPDGNVLKGEVIREITGTQDVAGKTYFVSISRFTGIPGINEFKTYRRKTAEGIFAISGTDLQKREYLETAFPLKGGATWTTDMGDQGRVNVTLEGSETVKAGDQEYKDCLKVNYKSDGSMASGHYLLAPNVGNIMESFTQDGLTFKFTLISFTVAS